MRVAVVGSRDWPDPDKVFDIVSTLEPGTVLVSGGARGVDTWAEQAAKQLGLEVRIFPADWQTHGRSAGFRRNVTIVENADLVLAFMTNGQSRGTRHTVTVALDKGVPVEVRFP